jgi:ATP-dependent RNA helicase DeaD
MKFSEFNLDRRTLDAIYALGFKEPTSIQEEVLPLALSGRDVVGQSCTGSGKTAAFSIPMIERIKVGGGSLKGLIVAPTRELCLQITKDIRALSRNNGLKVVPVYGGQSINIQLRHVGRADVIVATPGRLLDHLRRRSISLRQVEVLVLDEADRMLNMGFIDDIRKIINSTPTDRQTMLFSATIPPPIRQLSRQYMKAPEYVEISTELETPDIDEYFVQVGDKQKFQMLSFILATEEPQSVMIFCNTRRFTDIIAANLKKKVGYDAMGIHGDMKQSRRERVIKSFYRKEFKILCATDVASRGLDISDVSHVINYDVPIDPEDYTHRIGRTARMGKKGRAITLLSPSGHKDMRNLEKMLGPIEFADVEGFNPESYATLDPRLATKNRVPRPNRRRGKRRFSPVDRRGRRPY